MKKSELKKVCIDFLEAFQGVLSWKWDDRFDTVVAEFSVDDRDEIRKILERHLSFVWNAASIKKAPAVVRAVNDNFNGLRAGQLFYASDPGQEAFIFCVWWPWDNGESVSVRFAPVCEKASDREKAGLTEMFKSWLGF